MDISVSQTKDSYKEIFPGVINETGDYYKEVIAFAEKMNLLESFDEVMDSMNRKAKNGYTVKIYRDFAPYSFYFEQFYDGEPAGNGGIIYHGPIDNYGSGGAPTFSVTLTKTHGWSVHT